MSETEEETPKPARRMTFFILLVCFVYGALLSQYYLEERISEPRNFAFKREGEAERMVAITARLVAIDPVKGDLVVRLGFSPKGLADEFGVLNTRLILDINSSTGRTENEFLETKTMAPAEVTLSLDGKAQRYPFDVHTSALKIMGTEFDEQKHPYPVPIDVAISSELAGYRVDMESVNDSARPEHARIKFTVRRSNSVLLFDLFVMMLMAFVGISTFLVARSIMGGRKLELPFLQWMATLLFALLPLRNSMPCAPPLGTLSDYMAFFWAESLIAISLLILVRIWLQRPPS